MSNPYFRGPYAFGSGQLPPDPADAIHGFVARYEDGGASIVEPDMTELILADFQGQGATENDGAITVEEGTNFTVQLSGFILHNYGSSVILYYKWDDEEPVEFGRRQVNSNEPLLILTTASPTNRTNQAFRLFVSSDFEWAEFSWSDVQLIGYGYGA